MDGVAVASAVLDHVVKRIGCCGIFATHYHVLADAWAHEQKQVSVKHMSCEVENNPDDPVPKVLLRCVSQSCCGIVAAGLCPQLALLSTSFGSDPRFSCIVFSIWN